MEKLINEVKDISKKRTFTDISGRVQLAASRESIQIYDWSVSILSLTEQVLRINELRVICVLTIFRVSPLTSVEEAGAAPAL